MFHTGQRIAKQVFKRLHRPISGAVVFAMIFSMLAAVFQPVQAASLLATQVVEANIAYVVKEDTATAAAFADLITVEGHSTTIIPLSAVLDTDFSRYDLTIIAHDTGYLSDWGSEPGQAGHIAKASKVMGLGEGGYAFFGQLGSHIGWPKGWHGALDAVQAADASLDYFQTPTDLSAAAMTDPLKLYNELVDEVGIYLPDPIAGVIALGREPSAPNHYPLIAERCNQLWGFAGGPFQMTDTGKELFLNAVSFGLSHCAQSPEPGCFELFRPGEIPASTLINFDELGAPAEITSHYQPVYGVTFGPQIIAEELSTSASSSPNVAVNRAPAPPESDLRPPLRFHFDSGKTHVGFYMGLGNETAAGAMVGYDAAGNVICQITNTPVPELHKEFIGMYDPAGRIHAVTLQYTGRGSYLESIDDLYFAPHRGLPADDFPTPEEPVFGGADVRFEISESTNEVFRAKVQFPAPQLVPATSPDGAEEFTQFFVPGVENRDGAPGQPDVPVLHRILAVPKGATARLTGFRFETGEKLPVQLYPIQPAPADVPMPQEEVNLDEMPPPEFFMDMPFEWNREAYATDAPFPREVVQTTPLGSLRDLDIIQVSIAAGQYNPFFGELQILESVEFEIVFGGGEDWFLPGERIKNPFEIHFYPLYEQVLNHFTIWEYIGPIRDIVWGCVGEEYLIVTHPNFRDAADELRTWKVEKGISTRVVETGSGQGFIGDTNSAIRNYIRNRFNDCHVRISYVLLLGDAEFIPPFYRNTHYGDNAGTDLDYSLMDNADILPDIAVGRIPVDTLAQAQTVIDKIIAYEKTPPNNATFYDNMSIASYFQCCRTDVTQDGTTSRSFIETSELVRNALTGSYGVDRLYTTSTTYHNDYTAPRDTTPRRYRNGALLPAAIGGNSGFAWTANATSVADAVNAGRFLVMHRGHGGVNGWAQPGFSSANLSNLNNGALTPVMYSINCASGLWDNETLNAGAQNWNYGTSVNGSYWAERILRQEGGAVGVIGDTRNSPTWANSALARGMFDATWPNVLPAVGGNTSIRRLGDILNYGKIYMANQVGVAQTAGSVSQAEANTNLVLYHVIGDPTLEMWTSNPYQIILPNFYYELQKLQPDFWQLRYPLEGVLITALQDGEPVARGTVMRGVAELKFIDAAIGGSNPDSPITLSASHPDAAATLLREPRTTGPITPETGGRVDDPEGGISIRFPIGAVREPVEISLTHHITDVIVYPIPDNTRSLLHLRFEARTGDGSVYPHRFDEKFELRVKYGEGQPQAATYTLTGQQAWCAEIGCETIPDQIDAGTIQCHIYNEDTTQWEQQETGVDTDQDEVICGGDYLGEIALLELAQTDYEVLVPVVTR